MNKFSKKLYGYDPNEVNAFLDQIIGEVEKLVSESKVKNEEITQLKDKLIHYEALENTLNKALFVAQDTSDHIKNLARRESEIIVNDAKRNANRIVNEALLRAEKTEYEATLLKRNIAVFKRKVRAIIESQLDVISDMDKIEMENK